MAVYNVPAALPMTLYTFILLFVSHLLGDIVFTSYRLAVLKRTPGFHYQVLAIAGHSSVHAVFAGLLLLAFGGFWARAALAVFAVHFLIDFIRCRVEIGLYGPGRLYVKRSELVAWISGQSKETDKMTIKNLWPWFLIHFLDQGAHLGSLYVIAAVA